MKGKSPVVRMAHLVGTFFGISGLATDMQGTHIAFVGDRGNRRYPVPFILPPQNAWIWAKAKYLGNTGRFGTFYSDEDNKDKLWLAGACKAKLTETPLPCLLALPTFVAEFLGKPWGACLPHKLQKFVSDHINGWKLQVLPAQWQLVLDWCLATAQGGNDRTSVLNLKSLEPALCQDPEFLKWCKLHLDTTMGQEP